MEKISKKEKFITKAKNIHGNKYDYSDIEYINSTLKVKIKCNKHNIFFNQSPVEHLRSKNSCQECRNKPKKEKNKLGKNKNKILTTEEFIKRAKDKHGDKYDYSSSKYLLSRDKINIICPIHGEFEQIAASHVRGKGCNRCSTDNKIKLFSFTKEQFIDRANNSHNNKYDYSKVNYINSQTKVCITCPIHGDFQQLPYDHIAKHGCSLCTTSVSNGEKEINDFINENGITTICSSRSIINPYQLDIYIPSHNLAIEYNGLYWHNETKVSVDYHLNKTIQCEKQGIQLIHIFEDEWLNKKEIVKSKLMNLLGLTPNKIFARKTIIRELTKKEIDAFLNKNHLQGTLSTSIRLGLIYNDEIVSVMTFNKPRLGIGISYDGYELSRFCSNLDTSVIGGADKLLSYFIKKYNPKEIISYADRRWGQGGLYRKLGFSELNINKPNYWYIFGKTRKHRFGFRKEILKKRGFDITNKTEHQIMLERGIYRIYDCGTITFTKKFG